MTAVNETRQDAVAVHDARQHADPETAVALATASAALAGTELDGEWQIHLRDVALGTLSADTLIADEIARSKVLDP